jgi:hypothetical protein
MPLDVQKQAPTLRLRALRFKLAWQTIGLGEPDLDVPTSALVFVLGFFIVLEQKWALWTALTSLWPSEP